MATYTPYQERRTESEEYVYNFLNQIGVVHYFDIFRGKGYNSESDIPYLTSDDLEYAMMISSARDRQIILRNAKLYRPKRVKEVYEWLLVNNLEHYYINFEQNELTDLQKIAQLQLPDESTYYELEITMPGHKKRLERAVVKLKQKLIPEKPITFGRWGRPSCLPQAKFDFLCVKASLFSHKKPADKVCIDFMVDSGSDVSTVQEEILMSLDLELLGPIYSCGIHGGNHTNLYKACLKIGDEEMDIEIMGSNYDSLGSRVVRHFRHVIDGQHHVWLKGNYKDPLPAVIPLPAPKMLPGIMATAAVPSVPSAKIKPTASFATGPSKNISTSTETSEIDPIKRTSGKRKIAPSTMDLEPQPKVAIVSSPASFNNGGVSNPSKSTTASSKAFSQHCNKAQNLITSAHSSIEGSSLTDPRESLVRTEVLEQPANSFTLFGQQTNELEKCTSSISGISLAQHTPQDSNMNSFPSDSSDEGISSVQQRPRAGQSSVSTSQSSASTSQSSASTGQSSASTGQSSGSTGQSSASTGQSSASTGQSTRTLSPQISDEMVIDSEERISFRNLVPNSLQDTNDDIDHMMSGHATEPLFTWVDNWSKSHTSVVETDRAENIEVVHVLAAKNLNGSVEDNYEEVDVDSEPYRCESHDMAAGSKQGDFVRAHSDIMLLSIDELEMHEHNSKGAPDSNPSKENLTLSGDNLIITDSKVHNLHCENGETNQINGSNFHNRKLPSQ